MSIEPAPLHKNIPVFFKYRLYFWYDVKRNPTTMQGIIAEWIWFNRHIKVDSSSIFYHNLYDKGIVRIINQHCRKLKQNAYYCKHSKYSWYSQATAQVCREITFEHNIAHPRVLFHSVLSMLSMPWTLVLEICKWVYRISKLHWQIANSKHFLTTQSEKRFTLKPIMSL